MNTLCPNCNFNIDELINRLKSLPNTNGIRGSVKYVNYCPLCGQMLKQRCPYPGCDNTLLVNSLTKSCSECNREIVFCENCHKINKITEYKCVECRKSIKKDNVFLKNFANYCRTNVYTVNETIDVPQEFNNSVYVNANFSKSVIANGIIYYWKKSNNEIQLSSRNISELFDSGRWGEEGCGYKAHAGLSDIDNIEIFNRYVVTVMKNRLLINSADDKRIIQDINIRDLAENKEEGCDYKAAMLGDILILVIKNSSRTQTIISIDIDQNVTKTKEQSSIEEKNSISVDADPLVINDSSAYFAGYDGYFYKFELDSGLKELRIHKIDLKYPDNFPRGHYCANQIVAAEKWIYLFLNNATAANLFFFDKSNPNSCSVAFLSSKTNTARLNKVSFYGEYFYFFEEIKNLDGSSQLRFSQALITNFNRSIPLKSNFHSPIDYYIAVLQDTPYLIYMERVDIPNQLKIYRQPISNSANNEPRNKRLSVTDNCDDYEFLFFNNYIIVCDHAANKIIVKDWTTDN